MIVNTIIGVILISIVILNIIAPLVIYRIQKLPARVNYEAIDEDEFLENRSETFRYLDKNLKALGFEYIGSSKFLDTHNNTYFSLYSNAEGKRELTLKGAFILTWKSVFPGKNIYGKIDQYYSRKMLKNA